jgi:hypothetical protein
MRLDASLHPFHVIEKRLRPYTASVLLAGAVAGVVLILKGAVSVGVAITAVATALLFTTGTFAIPWGLTAYRRRIARLHRDAWIELASVLDAAVVRSDESPVQIDQQHLSSAAQDDLAMTDAALSALRKQQTDTVGAGIIVGVEGWRILDETAENLENATTINDRAAGYTLRRWMAQRRADYAEGLRSALDVADRFRRRLDRIRAPEALCEGHELFRDATDRFIAELRAVRQAWVSGDESSVERIAARLMREEMRLYDQVAAIVQAQCSRQAESLER